MQLPPGFVLDTPSSGPVYGAPPKVEPYAAEDQEFQRRADARAAEDQRFQREKFEREQAKAAQPPKDPKVTEGERAAAGYYRRATNAHRQYGQGILPRNPIAQTFVDILPENWENKIDGPERRDAQNYADEFIRAKLRKESGASISPEEMAKEFRVYFPVPGDGQADLERKAKLREEALQGLRIAAGAEADGALEGLTTPGQQGGPMSFEQISAEIKARVARGDDPAATIQWLVDSGHPPDKETIDAIIANRGNAAPVVTDDKWQERADLANQIEGEPGLGDLFGHGAMLGLSDEAAGVGNAAANVITSPFTGNFDPVAAYQQGNQLQDARLDQARQNAGWTGTATEIGGSLFSGNASGALKAAPSLFGRMGQGAKAGAAGGAVAGFGYGEGPSSLLTALGGGAAGATVGAALPVAGQFVRDRVQGFKRLTGRDPNLPRDLVNEAMTADGLTPSQAGAKMDEAHGRGSPMMIADTGENSRQLLASVGRQPGPSRAIVKDAVLPRQHAQSERIGEAVARDLGPTANIREMGDELITRARTAAKPVYEKAYAAPGAETVKLDDLALRPSFQKALGRAIDIAVEEGVDPTTLGLKMDANGIAQIVNSKKAHASWKTLDYVKRGLDDVLEASRDKTTGKLVLDNQGRATEATRKTLVARMDKINPDYAAARAAYAGPAKMREALEKGAKSLTRTPDDIVAMMKPMGDGEKDAFRLGVRKAIVDMVGSRKDGGDKVSQLLGTPKSRAVLSKVFGGKAEFERFVATLRDEEAMGHTYKAVAANSMTAERVAQDAATDDSGLADAAVGAAFSGNPAGVIASAIAKLANVGKFGAGEAGKRTRESVAALLTETDPALLRELIRAAQRAASRQQNLTMKNSQRAVGTGRNVGDVTGMGIGSAQKPQDN